MKRLIFILSFILLSSNALKAQVNKEVEVTKSYVPTVIKADKPMIKAVISDTTYMNPDVDYNIAPLAINTQLQTLPIKPATVTYWEFNKPASAQIKAGIGLPINTLFQGYASSHNASVGYMAAKIDHIGNYSKINKLDATQSQNEIAVAGGLYIAKHTLEGSLSYSNDLYNKYAFEQSASTFLNYQDFNATVRFGDNFVDMSRFNFNFGLDYSRFYDRRSNTNDKFLFESLFGKDIGLGKLLFNLDYQSISSSDTYENQNANIGISLASKIANWQLTLGAQYIYDNTKFDESNTPNHYFIPKLVINRSSSNAISPFVEIGGSIAQNSFAELSAINPYIYGGLAAKSSVEYNFAAGLSGQFASSAIAYRLDAEYTVGQNSRFWMLNVIENDDATIYDNYYTLELANLNTTSFNFRLDCKPVSNLLLAFDAHYYLYNDYDSDLLVNSRPDYQGSVRLEFRPRKLGFGVKGTIIGERNFTQSTVSTASATPVNSTVSLPSVFDMSAYLDLQSSEKFSFFLEGSNLCGAELYPWAGYKGFGLQITAGVKINFR